MFYSANKQNVKDTFCPSLTIFIKETYEPPPDKLLQWRRNNEELKAPIDKKGLMQHFCKKNLLQN